MHRRWIGVDVGKEHHHATALDQDGRVLWTRRLGNDQAAIQELIEQANAPAGAEAVEVTWAIDLTSSEAALLVALLLAARQQLRYLPGRALHRIAAAYCGEGKTDAKDSLILADQSRMRHDLASIQPKAEQLVELARLLAHRRDLVADVKRMVGRLRDSLTASFPGLERAFDYSSNRSALVLVQRFQTSQQLTSAGHAAIVAYLQANAPAGRNRKLIHAMADKALAAYAGLAPVPRDSGRRTGSLHRPQRYSQALRRVFYLSAMASLKRQGASRTCYDRKRAEGRRHVQAVIALARRRIDVLWAMLRDGRPYQPSGPATRSLPGKSGRLAQAC